MALNMNTDINMIDMKSGYDSDCLSQYPEDYESDGYESDNDYGDRLYHYICERTDEERERDYDEYRRSMNRFSAIIKKQNILKNKENEIKQIKEREEKERQEKLKQKELKEVKPKAFSWKVAAPVKIENIKIQNIIEEAKEDDKWTVVKVKERKIAENKQRFPTHEELKKLNTKTEMCESFRNGTTCKYGNRCNFAHSINELKTKTCKYNPCERVRQVSHDCYVNADKTRSKICECKHLNESEDNLYTRLTGIEKRPTEEEMDEFYLSLLESGEFDKPQEPVVKTKKPYVQKFKPMWPATFELLKNFSIENLKKIAYSNNIQTNQIIKTNKKYLTSQKTRNMLFLDIHKLIEKQYPADKEEILNFMESIKKHDEMAAKKLNKPKKMKIEDVKKSHIREKNRLNDEIREAKISIKRCDDTIRRLKSQNNISVYEKKQIEKNALLKKDLEQKLKTVEDNLKDIQDIKKFEEIFNLQNIKETPEEEVEEVVVKIEKKIVKPVKQSDIILVVNKQVTIKEEEKPVEDNSGWIDVVDRKKKNNIPEVTTSTLVKNNINKTRVCESLKTKVKCRHGDKCRFAHNKEELVIKKCDFSSNCTNQNCQFKHDTETDYEFYSKVGFKVNKPILSVKIANPTLPNSWASMASIKCFVPRPNGSMSSSLSSSMSCSLVNTPKSKPENIVNNNKTKLCNSLETGDKCKHGLKCRFAHSIDELVPKKCNYGDECHLVNVKSVNGNMLFFNVNKDRICKYQHTSESIETYRKRNKY